MTTDPRREEILARRVADPDGPGADRGDPMAPENLTPEDARLHEQNRQAWKMSGERDSPSVPPVDAAWQQLSSRLALGQPRARRLRLVRMAGLAVAASVLIAAVVLWPRVASDVPHVASADAGAQTSVTLADGSVVLLNSGSAIEYLATAEQRTVTLQGEAFFEVTSSEVPFVVTTPEASVTVLGTEFGVRSRDQATRVYVKSGNVSVSDGSTSVQIGAAEAAERVAGSPVIRLEREEVQGDIAWTSGGIAFVRTPVQEVLDEVSRRSGVTVRLAKPDLALRTVTATFPEFDAERLLEAVCISLECTVTIGEEIVIR